LSFEWRHLEGNILTSFGSSEVRSERQLNLLGCEYNLRKQFFAVSAFCDVLEEGFGRCIKFCKDQKMRLK
jgi:hypothetical protein